MGGLTRFSAPVVTTILSLIVCCAVRDARAQDGGAVLVEAGGVVASEDTVEGNPATDLAARDPVFDFSFAETAALQSALTRAETRIASYFEHAEVTYPPAAVTFVALKDEARLEVWADDGRGWVFIRSYLIRSASGRLGPKLRRGDHQVPEGIYRITAFNPQSRYYLSMRLDYPNAFDRAHGSTDGRPTLGGDIMIHGGRASDGCLPVGDGAVEELYALTTRVGLGNASVVVSPVDLRLTSVDRALARVSAAPPWLGALYESIAEELARFNSEHDSERPSLSGRELAAGRPKCKAYDAADCSRRCDKGDAASCARAGLMYRNGRGVTADPAKAWSLLAQACAAGDALGCAELSLLYLHDDGTRRDAARAAELARAACDVGDGHGCAYLANLCLDRITYPEAPDACGSEAVRQLRQKAVDTLAYDCTGWNAYDCDALAEIYGATNPDVAVRFASGACKSGDAGGCEQLARLAAAGFATTHSGGGTKQPPARSSGMFNARLFASKR